MDSNGQEGWKITNLQFLTSNEVTVLVAEGCQAESFRAAKRCTVRMWFTHPMAMMDGNKEPAISSTPRWQLGLKKASCHLHLLPKNQRIQDPNQIDIPSWELAKSRTKALWKITFLFPQGGDM